MVDIPNELVDVFCAGRAVLFLAAGCSIPSGISSADELAQRVAREYHARSGQQTALESFNEQTFGSPNPTLDVIAEYFFRRDGGRLDSFVNLVPFAEWTRPPNDAHRGVVRLAREGFADKVLTTNWDELVEAACHEVACGFVRVRKPDDLAQPAGAALQLFKIHGCRSDLTSIIAATSQIEGKDQSCLWANPQVAAAFQGCCVVFVGYSGSMKKISRTMADVGQWSPTGIRHYVVDRSDWASFAAKASEFVGAAHLAENQFLDCGSEDFVKALVDRLVRYRVWQVVGELGPNELSGILELIPVCAAVPFGAVPAFVEGIASADGSQVFLQTLLRKVDTYPVVKSNERLVARVAAWVSYLTARGWQSVGELPLMYKDDHWVYFAAGELGEPARRLARHVLLLVHGKPNLRRTVLGDGERGKVTCVLLLAQGTTADLAARDLGLGLQANDLTRGERETLIFRTETEFLQEVQLA